MPYACKKIKAALGIAAVYTEVAGHLRKGGAHQNGIQIDLLINRADKVVNLCEIKFYDAEFVITKQYAAALREKKPYSAKTQPTTKASSSLLLPVLV